VVAIADEIHQAYLPNRNASFTDVLLDVVGIIFFILVLRRIQNIPWFLKRIKSLRRITQ
jgi:VanZ family protein